MNGSSATGHCSSVTTGDGMTTCTQPTTSVLFDGNIPALTGLDGDMWASQLLILKKRTSVTRINFNFTSITDYSCRTWECSSGVLPLSTMGYISSHQTHKFLRLLSAPV